MRRPMDIYGRWWDLINTFLVIFGTMALMIWIMLDVSKEKSWLFTFVHNNPPVPRGELLGVLASVFVSGSLVAIIWAYTDALRRWTMCNLAKADLVSTLRSVDSSGVLNQALDSQHPNTPMLLVSSHVATHFRENAKDFAFLNPEAFSAMRDFYYAVDVYQNSRESASAGFARDDLSVIGLLASSCVSACAAARQLGSADPSLARIAESGMRTAETTNAILDDRLRRYSGRYFDFGRG